MAKRRLQLSFLKAVKRLKQSNIASNDKTTMGSVTLPILFLLTYINYSAKALLVRTVLVILINQNAIDYLAYGNIALT